MTKSPQSAIKLRLSRLVRCLAALCCLKLAIMGVALLDLPMPAWFDDNSEQRQSEPALKQEHAAPAENEIVAPVAMPEPEKQKLSPSLQEQPQGVEAAELAALAKPRAQGFGDNPGLPAPLVAAMPGAITPQPHSYVAPELPEPPALGAPLVQAGLSIPQPEHKRAEKEDSLWDMLNLKKLPIPGLGSAQAVHAAALDMPVPSTPTAKSPFMPAEQAGPMNNSAPIVLPGAPPLPDNLRPAQAGGQPPAAAPNPVGEAPAPRIQPRPSTLDPNSKAQELARQQQDILMLRQQMDQRLKDLKTAEEKMQDMIREAKQLEDQKVRSLVQMYANMKPRTAAQAMENMDERVAVRILSGMAPKQSGEILTYTNPAKTAKFTEMITRMRMTDQ